jgi:predicted  nucleic acid-binding Zn-ribbon protein
MAFYQPQTDSPESLTAEDLKNLILESLKLLKASVEELKEGELGIRSELNKLGSAQQELEKELVKTNVRLDMLETQISQLKAQASRHEAKRADAPP